MPIWLLLSKPQHVAFHNLCLDTTNIHPGLKHLLGLGLRFCPRPHLSTSKRDVQLYRFKRDGWLRLHFGKEPILDKESGLFLRSTWIPKLESLNQDIIQRLEDFERSIGNLFRRQRLTPSNLLPSQQATVQWLKNHDNLVVFPTDKNLGPAVMERNRYIQVAYDDHLSDKETYERLTKDEADRRVHETRQIIKRLVNTFVKAKRPNDAKYLQGMLQSNKDPFAYFYILAKVHKKPLATRPIVSVSGSILYALGKWVDRILQKICHRLPYRTASSIELVDEIRNLDTFPSSARLFTCDAVSMYTNIHLKYAKPSIEKYLTKNPQILQELGVPLVLFMQCLEIVMSRNVFRFGDTYWAQLKGTAMGSAPAPMYATLYFGICEQYFIHTYPELMFYRRYIDDGLGVWVHQSHLTPDFAARRWERFKDRFNRICTLNWTFGDLEKSVDFLDLSISFSDDGRLRTQIYEKALNLYLYLPPHSCHPPGMLKGLIYGMIYRFYRLSTNPEDALVNVKNLLLRLSRRGYSAKMLENMAQQAFRESKHLVRPLQTATVGEKTEVSKAMYLHMPYHPLDEPSRRYQQVFRDVLSNPPGKIPLAESDTRSGDYGLTPLTVAYSRPRNLSNFFSPRKLQPPGVNPSDLLLDGLGIFDDDQFMSDVSD